MKSEEMMAVDENKDHDLEVSFECIIPTLSVEVSMPFLFLIYKESYDKLRRNFGKTQEGLSTMPEMS